MSTSPQINAQRFVDLFFQGTGTCPLSTASLTLFDPTETQGHCIPNEGPQITLEPLAKASGHVFHETCVRLSTQKIKKEGGAGGINKEEELECCLQLHIEKDRKKDQLRLSQTKKKHQSAREKYRVESRGF